MKEICDRCWGKQYDAVMELQAVLALGQALRWLGDSFQRETLKLYMAFEEQWVNAVLGTPESPSSHE